MTPIDLASLESLLAAAQQTPWQAQRWKGAPDGGVFSGRQWVANASNEDADLIVVAVNALPALLAIARAAQAIEQDFDRAVQAHDPSDPRHRSHGGQHDNGRCCAFGNLNPSAVIHMRRLRDELRAALSPTVEGGL